MTNLSDLSDSISEFISEGKSFSWRMPTNKELGNEWETEWHIQNIFGAGDKYPGQWNHEKALFLDYIKGAKVKVVKLSKSMDGYWYDSTDELKSRIAHMGKNVDSLVTAFESGGSLPYPLFSKSGGKIDLLGGRTRSAVARILGIPVKGLIIDVRDASKSNPKMRRTEFINNGFSLYTYLTRRQRIEILRWLEHGQEGDMPHADEVGSLLDASEELESLKKFLGVIT